MEGGEGRGKLRAIMENDGIQGNHDLCPDPQVRRQSKNREQPETQQGNHCIYAGAAL